MKRKLAAALAVLCALACCMCGCAGGSGGPAAPVVPGGESSAGPTVPGEGSSTAPGEGSSAEGQEEELVTAAIEDTSEVLLNPGKGFVWYGGDSASSKRTNYVTAIGYHRYNWADIETADGVYNFEKIDKHIEDYREPGKKFAFGVMCANTSSSKEYITPKFVFDNGAEYDLSVDDSGAKQYIPKWTDEVFLAELDQFVEALGVRYNGDENIVFVDILSYGNWGEQHLFGFHMADKNYQYDARPDPEFIKTRYIEPYMRAFPDTLLVNPWGYDDLNDMYAELIEKGVSVRRDGIAKYTNGLDILAKAYGKLPVIFEYAGNYKDNINDGTEAEFNRMLEEAIAIAHPSYIELDIDWFDNNREYCDELANRMGYYFRLKQAKFCPAPKSAETKLELTFRNDGVAPIYEPCSVSVALLDPSGAEVKRFLTDVDPKSWLPGEPKTETVMLDISAVGPGEYKLAVGLFRDPADETPTYLLGSAGKTSTDWYIFGNITIG